MTKSDLNKVLSELHAKGIRHQDIADELNRQKVPTSSGSPWSAASVSYYMVRKLGLRRTVVYHKSNGVDKRTPSPGKSVTLGQLEEVVTSNLSERLKLHLIRSLMSTGA